MPYDHNHTNLKLSIHGRHICLYITVKNVGNVNKCLWLTHSNLG